MRPECHTQETRDRSRPAGNSDLTGCRPVHRVAITGLVAFVLAATLPAADWAPNLTVTATWDSNASNARSEIAQTDGLEVQADTLASERFELGPQDAVQGTVHLNATWWPQFDRLNTAAAGARGEWRHRFGADPFALELAVGVGADAVAARDWARQGAATELVFRFEKQLTEVARVTLRQAFTRQYADRDLYDAQAAGTSLELARELTDVARLVLGVDWRSGDLVSHSQPREDFDAVARTSAVVDTFGPPVIAYAVDARTLGWRAAVIRAVAASSAVVVAYEYRATTGGPVRFQNHRASLAIVHQF